MYKVSVIVPVFNVAAYVENCIRSLMEQTLDDIQYIIIDDGSSDNSLEIVERTISDYPQRTKDINIIKHHTNKGIAYTRQEGIDNAVGEYIVHCDSDDYIDITLYEELYQKAIEESADIVTCQSCFEEKGNLTKFAVPHFKDWYTFFKWPYRVVLCLVLHMIRRELIIDNNLRFFEGVNYAEDYGFVFRAYYYSKKNTSFNGSSFYHVNRDNTESLTHKGFIMKHLLAEEKCLYLLTRFIDDRGYELKDNFTLIPEKRMIKEGYLLCNPPDYKRWRRAFPEITPIVIKDKGLSKPYRICWFLGQYICSYFMKWYHCASKNRSKK